MAEKKTNEHFLISKIGKTRQNIDLTVKKI